MATPRASALALRRSPAATVVADYVSLIKPRVQALLLLTTVAAMEIAGEPSPALIAATCLGGYLSAGGAGAVNHWYDRDLDARMARTASRPVPAGRVAPRAALAFGCVLSALSVAWLTATVNVLAAALALSGFVGYTLVYTMWLKRRTPQNIVIGGAAGPGAPLGGLAGCVAARVRAAPRGVVVGEGGRRGQSRGPRAVGPPPRPPQHPHRAYRRGGGAVHVRHDVRRGGPLRLMSEQMLRICFNANAPRSR